MVVKVGMQTLLSLHAGMVRFTIILNALDVVVYLWTPLPDVAESRFGALSLFRCGVSPYFSFMPCGVSSALAVALRWSGSHGLWGRII